MKEVPRKLSKRKLFYILIVLFGVSCTFFSVNLPPLFSVSLSIFHHSLPPFLLSFSTEFFNDLYHRFLLSPKPNMKAMCLQAMAIVYGQCYEEIGPFNDTEFIVRKMAVVCAQI